MGGAKRDPVPPPPDLISALPDDVIHRISSFLHFNDIVNTSFLSTRWRHTWRRTTPLLVFDGVRHVNPLDFQSLVDGVLSQFTWPRVKKFHVTNFQYNQFYLPKLKVDRWLEFAEVHQVEDLRLRLIASSDGFRYKPPQLLYCLSGLVRLEVSACCFSLDGVTGIRWPNLEALSMVDVELSDDILGRILKGSPILESLTLAWCRGVKNIVIHSKRVKELVLMAGRFSDLEKILAPNSPT